MRARRLIAAIVVVTIGALAWAAPAHAAKVVTLSFKTQLANVSDETTTYGSRQDRKSTRLNSSH